MTGFLTPEKYLDIARQRAGTADFGDEQFEQDYHRFVESVITAGSMEPDRRDVFNEYVIRILVNRLRIIADRKQHPEIEDQVLLPPVAIISLPRTGTSKLQRMLGASNSFQNLLFWHVFMPARIAGQSDGGIEERIQTTRDFENWMFTQVPDYQLGHPMHAEEPEEETVLFEFTFRSPQLCSYFEAPDYAEWVGLADITPSFDFLLLQLKYLQWQLYKGNPKPWLLKAPLQLMYGDQLNRIFPQGMQILCPHRDPMELMLSNCRALEIGSKLFYREDKDVSGYGPRLATMLADMMKAHLQWRDQNPEIAVLDIAYRDAVERPLAVADRIYDFLGQPLQEAQRNAIANWDRKNPQSINNKTAYNNLARYGIDPGQINEIFADYRRRFAEYFLPSI